MVVVWWQGRLVHGRAVRVDQEKRTECLNLALSLRREGLKGDVEIKSENSAISRMEERAE